MAGWNVPRNGNLCVLRFDRLDEIEPDDEDDKTDVVYVLR